MRSAEQRFAPFFGRYLRSAFSVLWLLMLSIAAFPQKSTISISGHVYDQSGAVLPGASVKLTPSGGGLSREIRAEAGGEYRFDNLLIGSYELSAAAGGFRETRLTLNLAANYKREFDLVLQPEGVSETVNVAAARESFSTDAATTGAKLMNGLSTGIRIITTANSTISGWTRRSRHHSGLAEPARSGIRPSPESITTPIAASGTGGVSTTATRTPISRSISSIRSTAPSGCR